MTAALVGLDTETTSLRWDRRAWEIGVIERVPVTVKHPDGPDTCETDDREHQWFIDVQDLDLGNADLKSLEIGRFYERHPQMNGRPGSARVVRETAALARVEKLTRNAHLVGAVVNFDTEVLGNRMRETGICASWHYHLIDCEALAIGYLSGRGWPLANPGDPEALATELFDPAQLPWKSDDLSAALGVTVSEEERHTALGDARFALRVYDVVMGGTP
jgi:hypothetical protein